jgi:hypothetical protein
MEETFVMEPPSARQRVHIPFCDVDDLAFKNRHDPNFIAKISIKNATSVICCANSWWLTLFVDYFSENHASSSHNNIKQ